MTLLTITEIGDPILRQKTKSISDIPHHQQLYIDMIETLETVWWVWIAAPQVWKSLQLFVVSIKPSVNRPDLIEQWPYLVINPTIIKQSDNIIEDREWCLSVPWATPVTWLKGKVPRPDRIEAQRYDEQWNHHHKTLKWFEARVFLHEYDHLQWVFFLDRMTSFETLCTSDRYHKLI